MNNGILESVHNKLLTTTNHQNTPNKTRIWSYYHSKIVRRKKIWSITLKRKNLTMLSTNSQQLVSEFHEKEIKGSPRMIPSPELSHKSQSFLLLDLGSDSVPKSSSLCCLARYPRLLPHFFFFSLLLLMINTQYGWTQWQIDSKVMHLQSKRKKQTILI